jgi:hypothetical protein
MASATAASVATSEDARADNHWERAERKLQAANIDGAFSV